MSFKIVLPAFVARPVGLRVKPVAVMNGMALLGAIIAPWYLGALTFAMAIGLTFWFSIKGITAAGYWRHDPNLQPKRNVAIVMPRWAVAVMVVTTMPFVIWATKYLFSSLVIVLVVSSIATIVLLGVENLIKRNK